MKKQKMKYRCLNSNVMYFSLLNKNEFFFLVETFKTRLS